MRPAAVIDFEASCLPEDAASYPIEVALAKVGGMTQSWLIKPLRKWQYWDWDADAESLHGISQSMLQESGVDANIVIRELTAAAQGYDIYADTDLDAYWLEILCQGCGMLAPFPILYLGERFCNIGATRDQVIKALREAKSLLPKEHVARDDASRLALALSYIENKKIEARLY